MIIGQIIWKQFWCPMGFSQFPRILYVYSYSSQKTTARSILSSGCYLFLKSSVLHKQQGAAFDRDSRMTKFSTSNLPECSIELCFSLFFSDFTSALCKPANAFTYDFSLLTALSFLHRQSQLAEVHPFSLLLGCLSIPHRLGRQKLYLLFRVANVI